MSTDKLPFSARPSRRWLLRQTGMGFGSVALTQLLASEGLLAADGPAKPGENLPLDLRARTPHHAPRATAMISMFMHGGPSHVDLFDPKPELTKTAARIIREMSATVLSIAPAKNCWVAHGNSKNMANAAPKSAN